MKRNLILLYLFLFLMTSCKELTVKEEYSKNNYEFDKLLEFPIKERNRRNLEKKYIYLKQKIKTDEKLTVTEKELMLKEINYKLMILLDLK